MNVVPHSQLACRYVRVAAALANVAYGVGVSAYMRSLIAVAGVTGERWSLDVRYLALYCLLYACMVSSCYETDGTLLKGRTS